MLVLVLSTLLTAEIGHALQCIANCSVGEFRFEEPFRTPDGQCQQRIEASDCTVRVSFKYHDQVYTVGFGKNHSSADFICISSSRYLSYTINYLRFLTLKEKKLNYDQQAQDIRARGCQLSHGARVSVYDADYHSALHIECTRNLCNDDTTLARIKNILANNGLTDSNGRRVALGTKEIVSFPLLTFALISAIISYF